MSPSPTTTPPLSAAASPGGPRPQRSKRRRTLRDGRMTMGGGRNRHWRHRCSRRRAREDDRWGRRWRLRSMPTMTADSSQQQLPPSAEPALRRTSWRDDVDGRRRRSAADDARRRRGVGRARRRGGGGVDQPPAPGGRELLGVSQACDGMQIVQDDCSSHHRPRQRATARFIHAGHKAWRVPGQAGLLRQRGRGFSGSHRQPIGGYCVAGFRATLQSAAPAP